MASVVGMTGALTVTGVLPVFPSLVPVMLALPAAIPVTRPVELTVATDELLELQVMLRPLSAFPIASVKTAVACVVCPCVIVGDARRTVTVATGTGGTGGTGGTVAVVVPVTPSLVALIVVAPTAFIVRRPVELTVAIDASPLVHVIVFPAIVLPFPSRAAALSWTVCPTVAVGVVGDMATLATVGGTLVITEPHPMGRVLTTKLSSVRTFAAAAPPFANCSRKIALMPYVL
jgi:hypothetical protein